MRLEAPDLKARAPRLADDLSERGSVGSVADELTKLANLRDRGIVSQRAFKHQTRLLLTRAHPRVRVGRVLGWAGLAGTLAVIAAALVLAMNPTTVHPTSSRTVHLADTAASATQVQKALDYAQAYVGSGHDAGLCLQFVWEAWNAAGVNIGGRFSTDDPVIYWADNPEHWVEHASTHVYNDPPAGALVFWGADRWNSEGHVALSLGAGRVVSTAAYPYADGNSSSPDVFTFALAERSAVTYNYLGYVMPGQATTTSPSPAPATTVPALQVAPAQTIPSSSLQGGGSPNLQPAAGSSQLQPAAGSAALQPVASPAPSTTGPVGRPASQPPANIAPPAAAPSPSPASSDAETVGGVTHTWSNPSNAGGSQGPSIASHETVQVACRLTGMAVADGDTWWYRIASSGWNGSYYASADAFYNNGSTSGSLIGTPFVDPNVPTC